MKTRTFIGMMVMLTALVSMSRRGDRHLSHGSRYT